MPSKSRNKKKTKTRTKPSSPEALSRRLQNARRKRRISIKGASKRLSVTPNIIKQIEAGKFQDLGTNLRTSELLRLYAKLLELNPVEFEQAVPNSSRAHLTSSPKTRIYILSRATSLALIALVALLIIGYISFRIFTAVATPYLVIDSPQDRAVTDKSYVLVTGHTSEGAQVLINGIDVLVAPDGKFTTESILHPGANTIEITAVNGYGRRSHLTRQVIFRQN